MHIKQAQTALLSNHEVLLHLREVDAEYTGEDNTNRSRTKPSGLKDVLEDGLTYLQAEDQNKALVNLGDVHPNRPMTLYKGEHSLFRALAPKFRLNKAEYLQIYNLKPTTVVVLSLIIEESYDRFNDQELAEMLEIISRVFQEEEESIPAGVEDAELEPISNKLLGASRRRRRAPKRKA